MTLILDRVCQQVKTRKLKKEERGERTFDIIGREFGGTKNRKSVSLFVAKARVGRNPRTEHKMGTAKQK